MEHFVLKNKTTNCNWQMCANKANASYVLHMHLPV